MTGNIRAVAPALFCVGEEFWQEQPVQQWQARFGLGMLTGLYLTAAVALPDNTAVMLHFDGTNGQTTTLDESGRNVPITLSGSASLATASPKFGTSSLALSGGTANFPASVANVGTGDYTLSMWVKFQTQTTNVGYIFDFTGTGNNAVLYLGTDNLFYMFVSGQSFSTGAVTFVGDYHHLAVTRKNGQTYLFFDGVLKAQSASLAGGIGATSGTAYIGNAAGGGSPVNGNIDEFNLVVGTALWTSTFTPPSAPYGPFVPPNTFNRYDNYGLTLSNGDLTVAGIGNVYRGVRSYKSYSAGKLFFEVLCDLKANNVFGLGNAAANTASYAGSNANSVGYSQDGNVFVNGTSTSYAAYAAGDYLGCAVDFTLGKMWFSKNGEWLTGDPATGTGGFAIPSGALFAFITLYSASDQFTANLGGSSFVAAPPTGFTAWGGTTTYVPAFNPAKREVGYRITNGGRNAIRVTSNHGIAYGKVGASSGRKFFEVEVLNTPTSSGSNLYQIGMAKATGTTVSGYELTGAADTLGWGDNANIGTQGSNIGTAVTWVGGDVLGVYVDFTAGLFWLSKNGVITSGNPATGTGGYGLYGLAGAPIFAAVYGYYINTEYRLNTGGYQVAVKPPAGVVAAGFKMWDGSDFIQPAFYVETTQSLPFMTSNTAPSGHVASAQTTFSGYDAYRAFDNNTGSDYATDGTKTGWLQRDTPSAITIGKFILNGRGGEDPTTMYIAGSNDGVTWTTLIDQFTVAAGYTALTLEVPQARRAAFTKHRITWPVAGAGNAPGFRNVTILQANVAP